MQHEDIEDCLGQLEILTRIARFLASRGLAPYRCQYDFHSFGFLSIEAGTSHRRLRIARDGKERTLTYSTARFRNSSALPAWEQQAVTSSDITKRPADLDAWVETIVRNYETSGS